MDLFYMEREIIKKYKINRDNYGKLGKYSINKKSLLKGNLAVKNWNTLTGLSSKNPFLRVVHISDGCVNFINEILVNGDKFDMSLFFDLEHKEQKLIIKLLELSEAGKLIGFNYSEAYKNRFKILQGEMKDLGNDNPELIGEAIEVIEKLVLLKVIPFSKAKEMIDELKDELNETK